MWPFPFHSWEILAAGSTFTSQSEPSALPCPTEKTLPAVQSIKKVLAPVNPQTFSHGSPLCSLSIWLCPRYEEIVPRPDKHPRTTRHNSDVPSIALKFQVIKGWYKGYNANEDLIKILYALLIKGTYMSILTECANNARLKKYILYFTWLKERLDIEILRKANMRKLIPISTGWVWFFLELFWLTGKRKMFHRERGLVYT